MTWEILTAPGEIHLARIAVPGGWLYRTAAPGASPAMAFVPDTSKVDDDTWKVAQIRGTAELANQRDHLKADKAELLAALEIIAGTPKEGEPDPCEPDCRQSWDEEGMRMALDDIIDRARAAIAKAKGEQS